MKWNLPFVFVFWLVAAVWQPLAAQPAAGPVGDGLRGDYYAGRNFEQFRLRRIDASLGFDLSREAPAEGMPAENFSVRWTGWLRPPASGRYILHITVDDGARLWLDGRQVLDEWRGQGATTYRVELNLRAGHAYAVRLDYSQYGAISYLWLGWVQPAQFARADSAASWRTLWGLTASGPTAFPIATRYLFSHNPNLPPKPPLPQHVSMARQPQATPPARPTAQVPLRLVPRLTRPRPAAREPRVPRPALVVPSVPVSPPPVAIAPPGNMLDQLTQGQDVTLRALYFAQGKADLLPATQASLDTLATVLAQSPHLHLQVQGHTDNQGDSTLNRLLSQQRAEAVCRYLVGHGVASTQLQAVGYGGSRPIVSNELPRLRARNRRVVLQPLP
jgi:outer membrane protein OmpA-like peptidoglycan-associated protein